MDRPSKYVAGGTVQAGDGIYVERRADHELLEHCRRGDFVYILTARQLGKSSLMIRAGERLLEEGTAPVVIDLQKLGTPSSAEQWYRGVLLEVQGQLALTADVATWWNARSHLSYAHRLNLYLEQVVLSQLQGRIVIFIDEIDTTLALDYTDDFFVAIRYLYNARAGNSDLRRVSFVLIGVATPSDLIKDAERTPFNVGHRVEVTDFTESEAVPLIIGLPLTGEVGAACLRRVFFWSGGHPYLTLRIFAELQRQNPTEIDEAQIDSTVEGLFFGENGIRDSNLQFVRDMLTEKSPDRDRALSLYVRIARGASVRDKELERDISWLKLSGIVHPEGPLLRVRNRIYERAFLPDWAQSHISVDWKRRLYRLGAAMLGGIIVIAAVLAPIALWQWRNAERAAADAQRAAAQALNAQAQARLFEEAARAAHKEAEAARASLADSIRLRQQILAGTGGDLNTPDAATAARGIQFDATSTLYPYKTKAGLDTYGFQVFPVPASISGGLESLAFITYKFDHPTFPNTLYTAGRDRNFRASYDGVGCLTSVIALVEFKDLGKRPLVRRFDMCDLLRRHSSPRRERVR